MIKKIQISDTNVVEEVRQKMPVATSNLNGLLGKDSYRFVTAKPLMNVAAASAVKLYSAYLQTAVSSFVSVARVEGSLPSLFLVDFTLANLNSFQISVRRLSGSINATFYYKKEINRLTIYVVSHETYSIINNVPLTESGGYTHHLITEAIPADSVKIIID